VSRTRIVIEIPKAFIAACKAMGDVPSDVIADLITEFLDEPAEAVDDSAPALVPPPAPAGRGQRRGFAGSEVARRIRERFDPA
jgi:hypothetical protein